MNTICFSFFATYSLTALTYSEFGFDNAFMLTPIAVSLFTHKRCRQNENVNKAIDKIME